MNQYVGNLHAHERAAEMAAFARRLTERMARAHMTNSDLARTIWGTTTEGGKVVARGRNRIHLYLHAKELPGEATIERMAQALGCRVDDLRPTLTSPGGKTPRLALTLVGGRPDLALLTVNQVMPTKLATKIAAMIAASEADTELPQTRHQARAAASAAAATAPAPAEASLPAEDTASLRKARRAAWVAGQKPPTRRGVKAAPARAAAR